MKDLTLFQDGKINDSTVDFITRYYAVSEFCPPHWIDKKTNKPRIADMVVAAMYGQSLGLNLFMSLDKISIINGKPNAGVEALLAIINSQNLLQEMKQWYEGKISDGTRIAFCYMKRRNGVEITKSFSIENAKAANLYGKQVWKSYTDHMLVTRATGFAIKTIFPDVACGLITTEEAMDYPDQTNNNLSFSPASTHNVAISRTQMRQDSEISDEGMNIPETENNASTPSENASDDDVKFLEVKREKVKGLLNRTIEQFRGQSLDKIEERTMSEKYTSWISDFTKQFPDLVEGYQERLSALIEEKIKENN